MRRRPARSRRSRVRYTDADRARILAIARREGLSGPKAAKRFGISLLTFYNWRKKAGGNPAIKTRRNGRQDGRRAGQDGDLGEMMRREIRSRIAELLPQIIRGEVAAALGQTTSPRRRGSKAES